MNNTFPSEIGHYYRSDLAIKIAKELGHINIADPDFERGCPSYNVTDIFGNHDNQMTEKIRANYFYIYEYNSIVPPVFFR